MHSFALRFGLVAIAALAVACSSAEPTGVSSRGESTRTIPEGCKKIAAKCSSTPAQTDTCADRVVIGTSCERAFDPYVACLLGSPATCNAAGELDEVAQCASQGTAFRRACGVAEPVDAGALPAICERLKGYCKTTPTKDRDCVEAHATATSKGCATELEAAYGCLMDGKALCNAAKELDDGVPSCKPALDSYEACLAK